MPQHLREDDIRKTVEALVEANMNQVKAAQLLYVHRNTLVYRIQRIKKVTGYDCTDFRQLAKLWWIMGGE